RGLLPRLRARARVGLLTNNGAGALARLRAGGVVDFFDDVVCSADVGLAKPDAAVVRLARSRLGVAPAAGLIVDDLAAPRHGARPLGSQAPLHHRSRFNELVQLLDRLQLLPPVSPAP